jgi:hypothetical protein
VRKRLLLPLPVALLISFLIWELRYLFTGGVGTALQLALPTAAVGTLSFPVGLVAPWGPSSRALQAVWPWVSLVGYALYLGLSVLAWKRGSLKIAGLLVLVLVVNVISCQVQAPIIQRTVGIE